MKIALAAIFGIFLSCEAMGWELHITKKEYWADEDGPSISKSEWVKYVQSDPQIVQDSANTEDDYLFKIDTEEWPLWWNPDLGEIYTKNPNDSAIIKFKSIAKSLDAQVQDDEGELY